ncbi:MAG: helix-turn-helix transcriptional regulator [Butyrivibrio sp.]|nr:helix-turn-helix transcriptional regulator [Butyrivibrio sp.]
MYTTEEKISDSSQYFFHTPTAQAIDLFLYPTVIGRFEYLPGYSLERSRYDSYLLILIESGTMEILLDNKYQLAQKGDIVLLDCYNPHAYRTDTGCKTTWLHFDGKLAKGYYQHLSKELGSIITVSGFREALHIISDLFSSFCNRDLKPEAQMSIMIGNLLLSLFDHTPTGAASASDGIRKVTSYLTQNFSKNISLKEMADMAGLSLYHFTRKYKKETGVTPHQFLLSTRMSAAKYYLSNSTMTIKEIAFSCGFEDESTFCYSFRKREGKTPKQFRTGSALS